MDAGTMVEFDHPHNLLQNREGTFYKMVEETGHDTADVLHKLAAEVYNLSRFCLVPNILTLKRITYNATFIDSLTVLEF